MNESQSLMKRGLEKGSVTARDGYIKLKEGFVCSHSVFFMLSKLGRYKSHEIIRGNVSVADGKIQKYVALNKPKCIWNSCVDFQNCLLDLFQKFGVCFVWVFCLERIIFLIPFSSHIKFRSLLNHLKMA